MGIEVSALHAHLAELAGPGVLEPALGGRNCGLARVAAGLPSVAGVPEPRPKLVT
jgi:hypothetical protein